MPAQRNNANGVHAYHDKWIQIFAVPIFTSIGYYVTYNFIQLNLEFILLFISDLIKGFLVWHVLRWVIVRLDYYYPWDKSVVNRTLIQLIVPVGAALLTFIFCVELEYRFIRDFPLENFYTLDVWVVVTFLICGSVIYAALYFYQQYFAFKNKRPERANEKLLVRYANRELQVGFEEIIVFYSEGKQTWGLTKNLRKLPLDLSLDKLETLASSNFFRANRQYLLTPEVVKSMASEAYGKLKLETHSELNLDSTIIVSREKAAMFRKWYRLNGTAA